MQIPWTDLDELKRDGEDHVELVLFRNDRAISVIALTSTEPGHFDQPSPSDRGTPVTYEIFLDRLGVTSSLYLNRRLPAYIPVEPFDAYLRFRSRLPDREFVVTFVGIPDSERPQLVRSGLQLSNCQKGICQASVRVGSTGATDVPVTPLRNAYAKSPSTVIFTVAFFDEDTTPTNNRGYVTFVDQPYYAEPGSTTTWTASLAAGVQRDPDLSGTTPKETITFDAPLDRSNRTHVTGSATIGLRQTLGSRADVEFELTAKKGDFGQEVSAIQASKYFANVYVRSGATVTAGRFDVVAPTNSIAIAEGGEAIGISGRLGPLFAGAAYIAKKELADGSFTVDEIQKAVKAGASSLDRDNRAWVFQLRDIGSGNARGSAYAVRGDANRGRTFQIDSTSPPALAEFDVTYWTVGADATVNGRNMFVSAGAYHSKRTSDAPATVVRGDDDLEGTAGLITISYTNPNRDEVKAGKLASDFSVTGLIGAGGKFVGESQAFTPDLLFLSTFSRALREPTLPIGPGLTNKVYYGLIASTPKTGWLEWLGDVSAVGTTLKLHHYRLRDPVHHNANLGTEADFEVRVEAPKGVRYQLTLGGFLPGAGLTLADVGTRLIGKWQYAAKLNVTVRFE